MTTPPGGNNPGPWNDPNRHQQFGPPSGGFPVQGPPSGGYPVQGPPSSGYPVQGPPSGGYPAPGPQAGFNQPMYGQQTTMFNEPPKKKRSNKGLWIGAGAVVVVAAVVASYFVFIKFGGINDDKGEVANAKSFLSSTEKTWRDGLPKDGINTSKDAGCFYVLNKDDKISGQVACGPARRSSTEAGKVWDVYPFKTSTNSGKQRAGDLGKVKVSQGKPVGTLVTAAGDEPADDGKDLKEPPLPEADSHGVWSDKVKLDDKAKGDSVKLDDTSALIFPGVEMTVSNVVEYKSAAIDGKLSQPAKDEKFLAVTFSQDSGSVSGSTAPALGFDLDDKIYKSDVVLSGYDPEMTVLVSVPKKGESALVLDADGHQQSIDLATGKRVANPNFDIFYQPESTVSPASALTYPQVPVADGLTASMDATVNSATLSGYDDKLGWPDEGKSWLTVEVGQSVTLYSASGNSGYTSYTLDCTSSTIDGGVTPSSCDPVGGGVYSMVFAAPIGTKQFTVTFNAAITATAAGLPDLTFSFTGQSAAITLP
ncbi:hypothetical protein CLV47_10760 [Antricoccus suffuscus]|uniref:Uncharacterized protein n=1 Tax=Antricoccus suffuscus TaxID=1629062 RepID=A0A2T1A004_9ACTN|nr:proline-rich domain-containing protein [Antricoccus suffuscus]PRZ41933.1 hypothetical protein CLV47_10760 [Antricoccus suffuscus]